MGIPSLRGHMPTPSDKAKVNDLRHAPAATLAAIGDQAVILGGRLTKVTVMFKGYSHIVDGDNLYYSFIYLLYLFLGTTDITRYNHILIIDVIQLI